MASYGRWKITEYGRCLQKALLIDGRIRKCHISTRACIGPGDDVNAMYADERYPNRDRWCLSSREGIFRMGDLDDRQDAAFLLEKIDNEDVLILEPV